MTHRLAGYDRADRRRTEESGRTKRQRRKRAVAEKLAVHEVARTEPSTDIPIWVPEGKYVALVRGAVAGVGDSADVVTAALSTIHPSSKTESNAPSIQNYRPQGAPITRAGTCGETLRVTLPSQNSISSNRNCFTVCFYSIDT